MKTDKHTIGRVCNSLNAQSGSLRHEYARTGDKRFCNQSAIMDQAQILIRTMQSELEHANDVKEV